MEVGRQGWMGAGNLVENPCCQILHFDVKRHKKRLASGLHLHPLEEHASPEPLTAIGGQGMEHSLAGIKGAVWLGLVGKSKIRWLGRNGKGEQGCGRENVFKPTIVSDIIFSLTFTNNFWRPGSARTR